MTNDTKAIAIPTSEETQSHTKAEQHTLINELLRLVQDKDFTITPTLITLGKNIIPPIIINNQDLFSRLKSLIATLNPDVNRALNFLTFLIDEADDCIAKKIASTLSQLPYDKKEWHKITNTSDFKCLLDPQHFDRVEELLGHYINDPGVNTNIRRFVRAVLSTFSLGDKHWANINLLTDDKIIDSVTACLQTVLLSTQPHRTQSPQLQHSLFSCGVDHDCHSTSHNKLLSIEKVLREIFNPEENLDTDHDSRPFFQDDWCESNYSDSHNSGGL